MSFVSRVLIFLPSFIEVVDIVVIFLGRCWSNSLLLGLSLEELPLVIIIDGRIVIIVVWSDSFHTKLF